MNKLEDLVNQGKKVNIIIVKQPKFSFGDPSPLGFLGFGLALFMFGGVQLQLYWPDALVMSSLFFLGGFMQICAGLMHYVKDNLYGMVVHVSFGTVFAWMVVQQYLFTVGVTKTDPASTGIYLSIFLVHGIFLLLISIQFKIFHLIQFIMLLADVWLALTIISGVVKTKEEGENTAGSDVTTFSAGVVAILTSMLSIYYSGAMIINLKYERVLLPYKYDIFGGTIGKKLSFKLPKKKPIGEGEDMERELLPQGIEDEEIKGEIGDGLDVGSDSIDEFADHTDDEGFTDDDAIDGSDTEEDTGDETS